MFSYVAKQANSKHFKSHSIFVLLLNTANTAVFNEMLRIAQNLTLFVSNTYKNAQHSVLCCCSTVDTAEIAKTLTEQDRR